MAMATQKSVIMMSLSERRNGDSENKWQLKDNAFKMKDALDDNAILNDYYF